MPMRLLLLVALALGPLSLSVPAQAEPRSSDERDQHRYPWVPRATETLNGRFAAPPDFTRVPAHPSSFGGWLRTLPVAPPGTAVVSHKGARILAASDPRLAGVVAIDVGDKDLQQCADSIIRLHAEWQWFRGNRDMSYRLASGDALPFSRWLRGDRPVVSGGKGKITWTHHPGDESSSHASFRRYLDHVFTWANTQSLAAQGHRVSPAHLQPGDFVVQPGAPGHAVLVLDVARAEDGRRVALLGQGFMPAQSFHVLRDPRTGSAWFPIEEAGLKTPFWPTFGWDALRRL